MPCPYCGTSMSGRRIRNCGAPDCLRRWNQDRIRAFLQRHKAETGVRYEDRYKVERICAGCGKAFRTRHAAERCEDCQIREWQRTGGLASGARSTERRLERRRAGAQLVPAAGPLRISETARYRQALERIKVAAQGSRSKWVVWVGATCQRCGGSFVCMWTNGLPRWCSKRCLAASSKTRRRQRGGERVPYRRNEIFERDGWRCQIPECAMKTRRVRRSARVPDPMAPVIDHIVPLAAGGDVGGVDAPWNVQCGHFLCNSIKSDKLAAPALF